ncbi:DUF255 domain-containing protein [Kitasatospora sp. NPDC001574]
MPNRLADATSPYLLQHAGNPVDWWPWGPEAFEEARRRGVPVLLSVGYAACHWCHVMAHESFEDEGVAAYANERFVAVKVDREERPDVDAVYMEAVQAATGQGGWPMTVFLTPDKEPFYFGTYFPPEPRHGMPSFRQVLEGVHAAWRDRRDEVGEVAARIRADLSERASVYAVGSGVHQPPGETGLHEALVALSRDFDERRGGFGGAPKFPPAMVVEYLLRHHARTGSEAALEMAVRTGEAMARGGIHDQLGGGFARYAVDADWVVPHFEKMLYDNALLLRAYLHLWRATGSPLARRTALTTADFLLRELRTPEGAFASALDADSTDPATGRSVEGAYYVWTPAQLAEVLGDADGGYAAELFEVTGAGTFEHGSSVLQLLADPADAAAHERVRSRLFEARAARPAPARDDKGQIEEIQVYRANEEPGYFEDHYNILGRRLSGKPIDESGFPPPQLTKLSEDGPWIRAKDSPEAPDPHYLDIDEVPLGADKVTDPVRLKILDDLALKQQNAIKWDNLVTDWMNRTGHPDAQGVYRASHTEMGTAAEAFGEGAAKYHFVAEHYKGFESETLLGPKSGSDQFDQVWVHEDGRVLVIEAKSGPKTELGKRDLPSPSGMPGVKGQAVSQGSREYFLDILREMTKRGETDLVEKIEKALDTPGKLDYVVVKGDYNTGSYNGLLYQRFDISKGTLP